MTRPYTPRQMDVTRTGTDPRDARDGRLDDGASPEGTDLQIRIVEAQEAERSRIAQEVHDGPAQALSNAIFQVEYIDRVLDQDPRLARTELRFLRELLRRELGDVRAFISQLRPPLLVQLGLDGAIGDTVGTMSALTGVPIETELTASPDRLEETAQTVVLRVVQEALQNVRKHARASNVLVILAADRGQLVVRVEDDGVGFTLAGEPGPKHFGLRSMQERTELAGGSFHIGPRSPVGTAVGFRLPLS